MAVLVTRVNFVKLTLMTVLTLPVSTGGLVKIKSTATSAPVLRSSRETTVSTGLMTVLRIHVVNTVLASMESTATSVTVSQDTTGPTATRTLMIVRRLVRSQMVNHQDRV